MNHHGLSLNHHELSLSHHGLSRSYYGLSRRHLGVLIVRCLCNLIAAGKIVAAKVVVILVVAFVQMELQLTMLFVAINLDAYEDDDDEGK